VEPIRFQMLTCAVEIEAADPAVRMALRYLAQDAVQAVAPVAAVRYEVVAADGGGFAIREDGVEIEVAGDADAVMACIYHHAHDAAHRSLPPHLRLHAGSARLDGRRFVVVGGKNAGKTTLMIRLAFDGFEVEADECILILEDGQTLPFPRRFHIKPGSFDVVPELQAFKSRMPVLQVPPTSIHAFAPSDAGLSWRLAPGRADAVIFLDGGHGGPTKLRSIQAVEAAQRLAGHATMPERSRRWLGVLFDFVGRAANFVLTNGSPHESAAAIRDGLTKQRCIRPASRTSPPSPLNRSDVEGRDVTAV